MVALLTTGHVLPSMALIETSLSQTLHAMETTALIGNQNMG